MTAADGGGGRGLDRFSTAFLDRDGTLIRDTGYPSEPGEVELLPGAARAVRALNRAGVPVVVTTNQSGIGRGLLTPEEYRDVREEVRRRLREAGARIDLSLHCPHAPDGGCGCRKPRLGMHREAAGELEIDLGRALYAGDRRSDVEPAARTGGTGLLLRGRPGADEPPGAPRDGRDLPEGCRSAPDLWRGLAEWIGEEETR